MRRQSEALTAPSSSAATVGLGPPTRSTSSRTRDSSASPTQPSDFPAPIPARKRFFQQCARVRRPTALLLTHARLRIAVPRKLPVADESDGIADYDLPKTIGTIAPCLSVQRVARRVRTRTRDAFGADSCHSLSHQDRQACCECRPVALARVRGRERQSRGGEASQLTVARTGLHSFPRTSRCRRTSQ